MKKEYVTFNVFDVIVLCVRHLGEPPPPSPS